MADHVPPLSVEYCKVLPTGQGVPVGAAKLPLLGAHPVVQVLLLIVTAGGAELRVGQAAGAKRKSKAQASPA